MSLKHYDHRKPHLSSAFELLEADFEMQEEYEYQHYYRFWHDDLEEDPYSHYAYELQNDNIAEDLLGELYPLYKELKDSFCDENRYGISYDFNKRINLKDYMYAQNMSISFGFEYLGEVHKKYCINYHDLKYVILKSADYHSQVAGWFEIGKYTLAPKFTFKDHIKEFDEKEEVIEFVNKWMHSHAIALQKAKLKLIGMQDDED